MPCRLRPATVISQHQKHELRNRCVQRPSTRAIWGACQSCTERQIAIVALERQGGGVDHVVAGGLS